MIKARHYCDKCFLKCIYINLLFVVFGQKVKNCLSHNIIYIFVSRNRFIGQLMSAVSNFIIRLQIMDPSLPHLRKTLNDYEHLQSRLSKMTH